MHRFALLLLLLALLLIAARYFPTASPPKRRDDAWSERGAVRGRVRGPSGAIRGARVRFRGAAPMTLTDDDGRFQLSLPSRGARRVTAWKEGHFIAGAPVHASPLEILLTPLPARDYDGYRWISPERASGDDHACASCHVEIHREWTSGGHSRSATGRHFTNLYAGTDWHGDRTIGWSLVDERPNGIGVCAPCHAPSLEPGNPAFSDLRKVRDVHALGVHCDYCHKIEGEVEGARVGLEFGRYGLKLLRSEEGRLFFGPLDDVDRGEDAYSAFYKESRYCAFCHEGRVFGAPAYGTYGEWERSPASQRGVQCQDCHLKPTGAMTNVAPGRGGIERDPHTLGNHRFWDGSREAMLKRSLQVDVQFRPRDGAVDVTVTVRALHVGHRVPTGFPDRQVILVIEGRDANERSLTPSKEAPRLPDAVGSKLAGQAGKLYAKMFRDADGNGPVPFWSADGATSDTRLHPETPDRFTLRYPKSLRRIRARVLYRRFWQETIDLKSWPDRDLVIIDRELNFP